MVVREKMEKHDRKREEKRQRQLLREIRSKANERDFKEKRGVEKKRKHQQSAGTRKVPKKFPALLFERHTKKKNEREGETGKDRRNQGDGLEKCGE